MVIVYSIGFAICLATVSSLYSLGMMSRFVVAVSSSVIPPEIKIALFANLFATLFGSTIDLSIVEK